MDIHSLERFTEAQAYTYANALKEIQKGKKLSHWMWFIFPQLRGLGHSEMSYAYGIASLDEAKRYLAHPILSERLMEICNALLTHKTKRPIEIFGYIDAIKLQSSMTLFALVSEEDSVFHKVLKQFYQNQMSPKTLALLGLA